MWILVTVTLHTASGIAYSDVHACEFDALQIAQQSHDRNQPVRDVYCTDGKTRIYAVKDGKTLP